MYFVFLGGSLVFLFVRLFRVRDFGLLGRSSVHPFGLLVRSSVQLCGRGIVAHWWLLSRSGGIRIFFPSGGSPVFPFAIFFRVRGFSGCRGCRLR